MKSQESEANVFEKGLALPDIRGTGGLGRRASLGDFVGTARVTVPTSVGFFFNALIVVVFQLLEPQSFVPRIVNHRIWDNYQRAAWCGNEHTAGFLEYLA